MAYSDDLLSKMSLKPFFFSVLNLQHIVCSHKLRFWGNPEEMIKWHIKNRPCTLSYTSLPLYNPPIK